MCLSALLKNRKVSTDGYFYAAVLQNIENGVQKEGQYISLFKGDKIYEVGKWYDAAEVYNGKIFTSEGQEQLLNGFALRKDDCYFPYFHLFTNLEDAQEYGENYLSCLFKVYIAKCKIKEIVAVGLQGNATCVVARYRKIIEISKLEKSDNLKN